MFRRAAAVVIAAFAFAATTTAPASASDAVDQPATPTTACITCWA